MKRNRHSMLLSLGLILTACLLAAAAAGVHPEKKCYNSAGEEIPCDSNYLQTREAARATARNSGPSIVASPTPSPTGTPTSTATPSQTPMPTLMPEQGAAPPVAAAPQEATPPPSATMVLIPVLMVGCAGVLVLGLLFMVFRWLSGRRSIPPGSPN